MFVSVFSSRLSSATAFILISVLLVSATYVQWPEYRPFCLTSHASAHAQTYLRMLFVARMKSHIQLKMSCPLDILLSILHFCLRAPSLNNAVYVNSVSQALVTMARTLPKTEGPFYQVFCVGFQFRFFFRTAQTYTVYYFKC